MRSVIGHLVQFAHTTSLTGSLLCVRFASNATVPVLRISGELDVESRDAIQAAVIAAIASSAKLVILDLDELTFCDSHGVAMFIAASEEAKSQGTRVAVRNLLPPVRRLFEIAGIDGQIELIE